MSAPTLADVVARAIADAGDARVLLLGTVPLDESAAAARIERASPHDLLHGPQPDGAPYALAVVAGALESLDSEADGARVLGLLRDVHARRLLVAVPAHESRWGLEQMLALGLEAAGEAGTDSGPVALYAFDIDHYKRTPEWLNARHWANPELWGRYRW